MTVIVAALGWSWLDVDVDPLTGAVSADPRDRGAGPADLAALEHALRLAERWKAQVVAATVGPSEADVMLRDALAAGATEALRVEPASRTPGLRPALLVGGPDTAAALAAAPDPAVWSAGPRAVRRPLARPGQRLVPRFPRRGA